MLTAMRKDTKYLREPLDKTVRMNRKFVQELDPTEENSGTR